MTKHNEIETAVIPYERYFSVDFTLKCGICPKTFSITRGECVIMNCCKTLIHELCANNCIQARNICPRCLGKLKYTMCAKTKEEKQLFDFLNTSMNNLLCEEGNEMECEK